MSLAGKLLQSSPQYPWYREPVIVAVSGGADSVALLRALCELQLENSKLHVAHFNHGWRGTESEGDEQFVVELTKSLGLSITVGRASSGQPKTEQQARHDRYTFFKELATSRSTKWIAAAHTASDRVETTLHNLFRGTGLAGVCTPTVTRPLGHEIVLVRPLLNCFRSEVLAYLNGLNQEFREDSSNRNEAYRRNFLRNAVLPMLRETYGQRVDERVLSFSQLAEETLEFAQSIAQLYWQSVEALELKYVANDWLPAAVENELRFPAHTLSAQHWTVVQLALQTRMAERSWHLQEMTRKHWEMLKKYWREMPVPARIRPRAPRSLFQMPQHVSVYGQNGWLLLHLN